MTEELIRIGDLAKMAGISQRTVRYYEELGLISAAKRSTGGFRYFTNEDLNRVLIIKKLQLLDYPLSQIKDIFSLRHDSKSGEEAAPKVLTKLEEQAREVMNKLEQCKTLLEEIEKTKELVKECFGCQKKPDKESCSACPVLLNKAEIPLPFQAIL